MKPQHSSSLTKLAGFLSDVLPLYLFPAKSYPILTPFFSKKTKGGDLSLTHRTVLLVKITLKGDCHPIISVLHWLVFVIAASVCWCWILSEAAATIEISGWHLWVGAFLSDWRPARHQCKGGGSGRVIVKTMSSHSSCSAAPKLTI